MTSEEIGSAIFLMENAPNEEKGYASCFTLGGVCIGLFIGSISAVIVFSFVNEPALTLWGWRIPFIFGGLMSLATVVMRIKQPESREFVEFFKKSKKLKNPLLEVFKNNKFSVIRITLLCSLFAVAIYLFAVYIPNTINILHFEKYYTMLICSAGFLLTFFISLMVGKLVDKFGANIPLFISSFGFLFFSYPIFYLFSFHSFWPIIIAYILFSTLLGITTGSIMRAILKCFPVDIRFSGSCISFNLSMSLFGGTAPVLALYLSKTFTNPAAPAFILIFTAILTLIALFFNKEII